MGSKQHNWAPAPNKDSYAGFVDFRDGTVVIGKLGKRRVSKSGAANYPLTLEVPCDSVFALPEEQTPNGLRTVSEGQTVGIQELPCLRHLEQLEGRIVRLTHVRTEIRPYETRSRITIQVEVAADE
jgi:hypothetical protein